MSEEWMQFAIGDLVTRDGTDVQRILKVASDWHTIEVECVKAPLSGWCKVGDRESNLASRYQFAGSLIEGARVPAKLEETP